MAFQKRAPSIDMASIDHRSSPAPAYSSTCKSQEWPLTPQHTQSSTTTNGATSNNPYHHPAVMEEVPEKQSQNDEENPPTKPDYHDPNHPHYAEPLTKAYGHHSPPLPPRRRWPQKRVLIPWGLAVLFFLTTLWFVSIVLGARFLTILYPLPSSPPVHEINVFLDGRVFRGSEAAATATTTVLASSTLDVSSTPSVLYTGRSFLSPTGRPSSEDPGRLLEPRVDGFVTVTRSRL